MNRKWFKICSWLLGMLLFLFGLGYWSLSWLPRQKIRELEAEYIAKGGVTSLMELAPEPVPEAQNAAPLYLKAHELLETLEYEGENLFHYKTGYGTDYFDEEKEEAFSILIDDPVFAEAMQLLDQAGQLPDCQFEVDYAISPNDILLPHISLILELSQILNTYLRYHLDRELSVDSIKVLDRMNGIASRLENEPLLISALVRVANLTFYTEALNRYLARTEYFEEELSELRRQVDRLPDYISFQTTLTAERIWALSVLDSGEFSRFNMDFEDVVDQLSSPVELLIELSTPLFSAWDELYYWQFMLETEKVHQRAYAEIDWAAETKREEDIPSVYVFSLEALGRYHKSRQKLEKAGARVSLAHIALDVYEYKRENGTFPERIEALPNAGRLDPFVNKPFRYEKTGDGFRLYSVGPNQVDDGGVEDRKAKKDDLLFSHPYVN